MRLNKSCLYTVTVVSLSAAIRFADKVIRPMNGIFTDPI